MACEMVSTSAKLPLTTTALMLMALSKMSSTRSDRPMNTKLSSVTTNAHWSAVRSLFILSITYIVAQSAPVCWLRGIIALLWFALGN